MFLWAPAWCSVASCFSRLASNSGPCPALPAFSSEAYLGPGLLLLIFFYKLITSYYSPYCVIYFLYYLFPVYIRAGILSVCLNEFISEKKG